MKHLRRASAPILATTLRLFILALAIHGGLDLARDAIAQEDQQAFMPYAEQSASLADRVAELEDLLVHFSRDGDTVVVTGANVQVVNGTGTTDGEPNGLGNVVVGYNEERADDGDPWTDDTNDRSGSHMLVVGARHNYSRFGGIVIGDFNTASGDNSSVSGGTENEASGNFSSVSGGGGNTACGDSSSVSSGILNTAYGGGSSVSGGQNNIASDDYSSVSGGWDNTASGPGSSVSGGEDNYANGLATSISGGRDRAALDDYNWAAGSLLEER